MGTIPVAALALILLASPSPLRAEEAPRLPVPEVVTAPTVLPTPEVLQEAHIARTTYPAADESTASQATTNRSLLIIIGLALAVGALLVVAFG